MIIRLNDLRHDRYKIKRKRKFAFFPTIVWNYNFDSEESFKSMIWFEEYVQSYRYEKSLFHPITGFSWVKRYKMLPNYRGRHYELNGSFSNKL